MNPLAGLFLALACLLGIAATGCVFELAYGDPDLGVTATRWILGASIPGTQSFSLSSLGSAHHDTRQGFSVSPPQKLKTSSLSGTTILTSFMAL